MPVNKFCQNFNWFFEKFIYTEINSLIWLLFIMKYFVFVDESWTWTKDQYFWLWCLIIPNYKIWEYNSFLQKKHDQIFTLTKQNEINMLKSLSWTDRENFLIWRNSPYEMKFKNINKTTLQWYLRLLSQYFKFEKAKFCVLVIDKYIYPFPKWMTYFDTYLNTLTMLLKNNFSDNDEFVILPDSISSSDWRNYELELQNRLIKVNKKCFWVCRLDSRSNLFIQTTDCLIWAVLADYKNIKNESKLIFVSKLKEKLWINSLQQSIRLNKPNYFSIRNYQKK